MPRRIVKLVLLGAVGAAAAAGSTAGPHPLRRLASETRIVPPLADPTLVPGVARCTSDGRCTVTDARGTRPGTMLVVTP